MFLVTLICSICLFNYAKAGHVIVTCERNCNVTGTQINGGEGDDIALKYIVTTKDFFTVYIQHQFKTKLPVLIVTLKQNGDLMINPNLPDFVRFNDKKSRKRDNGYELSFEVPKFNKTLENSAFFSRITYNNGSYSDCNRALSILSEPKLASEWKSRYKSWEHNGIHITFGLTGNPRPNVTAHIEGMYVNFTSSGGPNPFIYDSSLEDVSKLLCGKKLHVSAIGYKRTLYLFSAIDVLFPPDVPTDLSASQQVETSCASVKWTKIESGECNVNYILDYNYNTTGSRTMYNTTITNVTSVSLCFPKLIVPYDVTFRVKAQVWNQTSNFSSPHILKLTATKHESTGNSNDAIIVSTLAGIAVLVIIIAVVVLVRTGRLRFCNYNSSPKNNSSRAEPKGAVTPSVHHNAVNNGMEADYAHISDIQLHDQASIQPTDYAELGPGGRMEEQHEAVEPSSYAQVNTDKAYYPSLNPKAPNREPEPDYAALSKEPPLPGRKEQGGETAQYAISSKLKTAS